MLGIHDVAANFVNEIKIEAARLLAVASTLALSQFVNRYFD